MKSSPARASRQESAHIRRRFAPATCCSSLVTRGRSRDCSAGRLHVRRAGTQTFRNVDAVLRAGGSRPELVVNTTVLVADANDFAELNELYGEFFATDPPARMTMQVPLPRGLLLSVGCVAIIELTASYS